MAKDLWSEYGLLTPEEHVELLKSAVPESFPAEQFVAMAKKLTALSGKLLELDITREGMFRRFVLWKAKSVLEDARNEEETATRIRQLSSKFAKGFDAVSAGKPTKVTDAFEAAFFLGILVGNGDLPRERLEQIQFEMRQQQQEIAKRSASQKAAEKRGTDPLLQIVRDVLGSRPICRGLAGQLHQPINVKLRLCKLPEIPVSKLDQVRRRLKIIGDERKTRAA